jgi:hypothetical protein
MRKTLRLSAGFGHSDWPDPKRFDYTFDHIASVIDDFTQAVGLSHYTLYVQDTPGAPQSWVIACTGHAAGKAATMLASSCSPLRDSWRPDTP